jgi:hypothetical protein
MSVYNAPMSAKMFLIPHSGNDLYSLANSVPLRHEQAAPTGIVGYRKPDGVTRVPSRTADQYSLLRTA